MLITTNKASYLLTLDNVLPKHSLQVPTKSQALQPCGPSRVAAVGPYILSSTAAPGPPVPSRQELLIKPAYPDGTTTLPMPDSSTKAPPRPLKPYSGKNIVSLWMILLCVCSIVIVCVRLWLC